MRPAQNHRCRQIPIPQPPKSSRNKSPIYYAMKILINALALIATLAPAFAAAPLPAMKDGNWSSLKLAWARPDAPNGESGIPIGNGHLGARVRGGIETELLALNDKWFWSGGPGLIAPDPARRVALEATREALAAGDIPGADVAAKGMWGG